MILACRWVEFRNEVLQHERGRDILFSGRPDNNGIGWINERITAVVQVNYLVVLWHLFLPPAAHLWD